MVQDCGMAYPRQQALSSVQLQQRRLEAAPGD